MRQNTLFATVGICVLLLAIVPSVSFAVDATGPSGSSSLLPIREVTIYKNNYAFVLREGSVAVDTAGKAVLDNLQSPVMGTFWPASTDPKARLTSVVAGQTIVNSTREADSLVEMLQSNIGASVMVQESTPGYPAYQATVVSAGSILQFQTQSGLRAVPDSQLQSLTFLSSPVHQVPNSTSRDVLTLHFDLTGEKRAQVGVGLVYLQKGLQWIPSYRIALDGKGTAHVELEATIVNHLADLDDVTADLAIGVPSFAMQDTPDPIGVIQAAAQLGAQLDYSTSMGQVLSNGIAVGGGFGGYAGSTSFGDQVSSPGNAPQPQVFNAEQTEDLFVFTVKHITLKSGESMVMPVRSFDIPYQDIYKIEMPFTPNPDLVGNLTMDSIRQISDSLLPHAIHALRLSNSSDQPITTAPALILRNGVLIAQGKTTYTAAGGTCDVDTTTAVDVTVKRIEHETSRQENVMHRDGYDIERVNLAGTADITNYKTAPITVEVKRYVFGFVDTADSPATIDQPSLFDNDSFTSADSYPVWFSSYQWQQWWADLNGIGRVSWDSKIGAGKTESINYTWHYFWHE